MREADRLAGGANLVLARGVIESTIDFIRGSPSAQEPACVGLLADLQQILRGLADARVSHVSELFFGHPFFCLYFFRPFVRKFLSKASVQYDPKTATSPAIVRAPNGAPMCGCRGLLGETFSPDIRLSRLLPTNCFESMCHLNCSLRTLFGSVN